MTLDDQYAIDRTDNQMMAHVARDWAATVRVRFFGASVDGTP
jgi:hypothetical protein